MWYSPRNIEIAFGHAGLTHYGGVLFFGEFIRMLQLRRFLTRHLRYPRRNQDYQLSQMILSLVYPIILGWIVWRRHHCCVRMAPFSI